MGGLKGNFGLGKNRTVYGAHPCPKISANSQEIAYHVRRSDLSAGELDLEIATYIRSGFYSESTLEDKLKILNNKVVAKKREASFIDAWELFHNSFKDNEKQLIDAIEKSFRAGVNHIDPISLNGTVTLLRDLGRDKLADELIELYIAENAAAAKTLDLDIYPFRGEISDKRILSRFLEVTLQNTQLPNLSDVVRKISEINGWNPKDEDVLKNATAEDYYEFFKGTESKHLALYVKSCLRFDGCIGAKTNQALERIASESKLNEIRMRKFGIKGKI
jgi:hypothetical protein